MSVGSHRIALSNNTSGSELVLEEITGQPQAWASNTGIPNPS